MALKIHTATEPIPSMAGLPVDKPSTSRLPDLIGTVLVAIGIFIWLGLDATRQQIVFSVPWMIVLAIASLVALVVCGLALWRRTRFS